MGLANFLREVNKKIDLFSTSTTLHVGNDESYSTSSGGIFSLIFFILMGLYGYQTMLPMVQKTEPTVSESVAFNASGPSLSLENFIYGFAISTSASITADDNWTNLTVGSYFDVTINYNYCDPFDCIEPINLGLIPCPPD